jgi:hypothetical protein
MSLIQKRADRRYRWLDPDGRERSRTFTPKADEILSLTPSPLQEAEPRSWSRSATAATP